MARIRTIKPDFPFSPDTGRISRDARLFFIESWMICDREGRYAWEPGRVKAQLFPYDDDADVEGWLEVIVAQNLAVAYEVDGHRYVWVCTFTEHQRPHPKEPRSTIPACPTDTPRRVVPWQNTADRVLPGSIPSSPVGREGDLGVGDLGEHPIVLSRFPIIKKRNLSAFWEGPIFDVPDAWARKLLTAANGTTTEDDIRAFARQTTAVMEAAKEPVDDSIHLFAWLDAKWRDYRKGRAAVAADASHEREFAAAEARRRAQAAEIEAIGR